MRIKRFRYIILIVVFLFALAGFSLYSFYKKNVNNVITEHIVQDEAQIPSLYNVMGDYSINKMDGYRNEMGSVVSDNVLSLVMEDFSIKFRISDIDISKVNDYEYSIRRFDTDELIERGDRKRVESEIIDLHLSSLISENMEYLMEIIIYTTDNTYHYYTRILRSNTAFALNIIDEANTFSDNNFDSVNAKANTVYLESDGTANSRGLEYVTLKSDFDMMVYNEMKLTPHEKEVRLVNYDGKVGEIHLSFLADTEEKSYKIEENFIFKSGAQRLYILDYARTMNEVVPEHLSYSEKIDLGIGNRKIKTITDDTISKNAFVIDGKLFLADNKNKRIDLIYKCKDCEDTIPLMFSDGLYFITFGRSMYGRYAGDVGVRLLKYEQNDRKISALTFVKLDTDVGSLSDSIGEVAFMGDSGMLYLKLIDKVIGLDIKSGNYIIVAENLENERYSISEDKSLISWNTGDGLHIYNFVTGESKQLTSADEVLLPIGYIGNDLVVGIESQNISNTVNGKSTGGIFEKIIIYNNLLELQKEYSYDDLYIDDIVVDGNRAHINLYRFDGENFVRSGEDTIISSKSIIKDSRISSYNDDYRGKNYVIDITKNVPEEISYAPDINIDSEETKYTIELNSEYMKKMYYVYINSELSGIYDDPVVAIDDAYKDMGFVRRDGMTVYARAMVENAASVNFDTSKAAQYWENWENDKLTRFQGITLKEAMYFITSNNPVFTFTASNNPVIITAYDRKSITVYDINSASVQKIDLNEAQNIFNSTQNDFSCFFTFMN